MEKEPQINVIVNLPKIDRFERGIFDESYYEGNFSIMLDELARGDDLSEFEPYEATGDSGADRHVKEFNSIVSDLNEAIKKYNSLDKGKRKTNEAEISNFCQQLLNAFYVKRPDKEEKVGEFLKKFNEVIRRSPESKEKKKRERKIPDENQVAALRLMLKNDQGIKSNVEFCKKEDYFVNVTNLINQLAKKDTSSSLPDYSQRCGINYNELTDEEKDTVDEISKNIKEINGFMGELSLMKEKSGRKWDLISLKIVTRCADLRLLTSPEPDPLTAEKIRKNLYKLYDDMVIAARFENRK